MPDLFNVQVELNHGDDGPVVSIVVPVLMDGMGRTETIDDYADRASATALDGLRPFLNNRTHFVPALRLPLELTVSPCCALHRDDCCDPDDCGPCCAGCPTCPTLNNLQETTS